MKLNYFPQIDFIKGFAMVFVILLHTIPAQILLMIYSGLSISQAVPLLFIILGVTTAISFQKESTDKIWELFTKDYLIKKIERYYLPFLFMSILAIIFGLIFTSGCFTLTHIMKELTLTLLGIFPNGGPGDYFVSCLIQWIFIAPFMNIAFKKDPKISLIGCLIIDFIFELLAPSFPIYDIMYRRCIFRYIGAIALGMYISHDLLTQGHINLRERKYWFIVPFSIISIIYLIFFSAIDIPLFRPEWGTQNILSYFYPLLLIILIFNFFNHITDILGERFIAIIKKIGKSSYHIFIFQMFYFGCIMKYFTGNLLDFLKMNNSIFVYFLIGGTVILLNLMVTLSIGILFNRCETRIKTILGRAR